VIDFVFFCSLCDKRTGTVIGITNSLRTPNGNLNPIELSSCSKRRFCILEFSVIFNGFYDFYPKYFLCQLLCVCVYMCACLGHELVFTCFWVITTFYDWILNRIPNLSKPSTWTGEQLAELQASRTSSLHWWDFADWAAGKGSEAGNGWLVLYMVCSTHSSLAVLFWCWYILCCPTHIIVRFMDGYHGGSHFYVSRITALGTLSLSLSLSTHNLACARGFSWCASLLEYVQIIVLIPVTRLDSLHMRKIWWG